MILAMVRLQCKNTLDNHRSPLETVAERQTRPLNSIYPLIFLDALHAEIRDEGLVHTKGVYVALGVATR
jgi:transposase-like protein